MGRPADYEWKPLGQSRDPVPGVPDRISEEIAHLTAVARQITDQVATLRRIGSDGTLIGQYAGKLRDKANETAGDLEKVIGRYQKVSSALSNWLPDLEQAQAQSITALNQAEGPYKTVSTPVAAPPAADQTPEQAKAAHDHQKTVDQAQGVLNDAIALLGKATSLRDHSSDTHAAQIRSAIHDGMKDSRWDRFKNWVHGFAPILADICTILEVIATALAIVAFILAQFIPGVDILVDIAVAATIAALAGRVLLAVTQNGSWWDVAVDAFALLTFGAGRALGSVSKIIAKNALEKGAVLLKSQQFLDELAGLAAKAPEIEEAAGENLKGATKLLMAAGGYGEEGTAIDQMLKVAARFPGSVADHSGDALALSRIMGLSGGFATFVTGAGSVVFGGVTLSGPGGHPFLDIHIPVISDWYKRTFEVPTGG
jgi:hypothetical protein